MIFTIGHTETYTKLLKDAKKRNELPIKKGRKLDYPGGSVWKTEREAKTYLEENNMDDYSVYKVFADWERDTVPHPGKPYHDLLKDAPIMKSIDISKLKR